MSDAIWIILTGSFVAGACALLGTFLLLRKMTMLGDAISHSVLPGIVAAYLVAGQREPVTLILGASLLGLGTTFLVEFIHHRLKLNSDAAIGMTYTFLFAIGVILVTQFAGQVDLDQECVLFGEINYVSLDTWTLASGTELGPVKTWVTGGMFLFTLAFVFIFYKELQLTTFDPAFARASGLRTTLWHYLLMAMVSLATVTAFDAVGAILVVAFLVVPAATAFQLTRGLPVMLALAVGFGFAASAGGYFIADVLNASVSGAMALTAGIIFLCVMAVKVWTRKRSSGNPDLAAE